MCYYQPIPVKKLPLKLLTIFLIIAPFLSAQWGSDGLVTARLILEKPGLAPNDSMLVAVEFAMKDEWHIYWTNPGDGGLKTTFSWTLPAGVTICEPMLPYPIQFIVDDMVNFGYEKQAVFLFWLKTAPSYRPGAADTIAAVIDWLACKQECIPGTSEVAVPLTQGTSTPDTLKPYFRAAHSKLPVTDFPLQFSSQLTGKTVEITLTPAPGSQTDYSNIQFFPVQEGLFAYTPAPRMIQQGSVWKMELHLSPLHTAIPSHIDAVWVLPGGFDDAGTKKAIRTDFQLHKTP